MGRLYFPSEGRRAEDFFALKNPTASAGFEPANLGTKGQHATSRPPKPMWRYLRWSNLIDAYKKLWIIKLKKIQIPLLAPFDVCLTISEIHLTHPFMRPDVYPLHNLWFRPVFPYFQYLSMIFRQHEAKRLKYLILHISSPPPNPTQTEIFITRMFYITTTNDGNVNFR